MARIVWFNSNAMTEDGNGGFRPSTNDEILNAGIDVPEAVRASMAAKAQADKTANANAAVRQGKAPVGSTPESPENSMGTTGWERFVVKNLVNSPATAKAYLQAHGYEVAEYGDGFNFAVRKGPGQPWRMVDPKGGADVGWDLLDLTADALGAAAVIEGLAIGGPAGAMGAGMLAEAGRQRAGQIAGVPQAMDPAKMGWAGVAGGALPALGGVAEAAQPGMLKLAGAGLKASAKIIGTEPETLLARARIPGFGAMESTVSVAKRIRAQLASFTDDLTPARKEAAAIIDHLDGQGVVVDMSPMLERMKSMALSPVEVTKTRKSLSIQNTAEEFKKLSEVGGERYIPTATGKIARPGISRGSDVVGRNIVQSTKTSTVSKTAEEMQPTSVEAGLAGMEDPSIHSLALRMFQRAKGTLATGGYDETQVPIKLAEEMKRRVQKAAARAKSYEDVELSTATRAFMRDVAGIGRKQVSTVADASGVVGPASGKPYSVNMAEVDRTMKIVGAMEDTFNSGVKEHQRAASAQRAVKALYGESGTEYMDHLHNFDKLVGTDLAAEAHKASVGKAYGAAGEVGVLPRFTAQGSFLGPSLLLGGGAAGLATGNPLAYAGMAAGSPMTNMAAVKGSLAIGDVVSKLAAGPVGQAVTSMPSRMTTQMALQEILSRTGQ